MSRLQPAPRNLSSAEADSNNRGRNAGLKARTTRTRPPRNGTREDLTSEYLIIHHVVGNESPNSAISPHSISRWRSGESFIPAEIR